MSRSTLAQASRLASRALQRSARNPSSFRFAAPTSQLISRSIPTRRAFSVCSAHAKGIMPDSEDPHAHAAPTESKYTAIELSDDQYHQLADVYMEDILSKFEYLQDAKEGLDVEYSSGVMTLAVADKGTYVINKQPPNKQIWLSSPISGPKRYDWSVTSDGQNDKEGTAEGAWVYTRDGSTLNSLFLEELGIDLDTPIDE